MKKLTYGALALCLVFGPCVPALGWCITVQNAKCDRTFSNPSCLAQTGSSCVYDASGCRTSCGGGGSWDECDPEVQGYCIEYQIP
jgi:hypothetical protein